MTDALVGNVESAAPAASGRRGVRRFLWHFMEMVIAMVVGMLAVDPALKLAYRLAGGPGIFARPDVGALVMATSMTLGMAFWMRYRGHRWAPVAEMGAAMYLPFLPFLVLFWAGVVPGDVVMLGGHLLMLPAMLLAMLRRRAEYSHDHAPAAPGAGSPHTTPARRIVAALKHRWPSLLALAMSLDSFVAPVVPHPWLLMVLPTAYLVIGGVRGTLRGKGVVALQLAGFVAYLALTLVTLSVNEDLARYLVAAGWLAHAAWDLAHHRANKVVPRGYAEWCAVFDAVIGLTIIFLM